MPRGTSDRSSTRRLDRRPPRIVDGEVIALDDRGEPDFALLQARIKGGGWCADAVRLRSLRPALLDAVPCSTSRSSRGDGCSLRPCVRTPRAPERGHLGDGMAFFEAARIRGLEGIMAKDRRSTYLPGKRSMAWQKVKIRPGAGARRRWLGEGDGLGRRSGALLVGVYEDGALQYAGKVGAGFTADIRTELLAALAPLAAEESPFATPLPRPVTRTALWLRPELVIRAEFAGWTGDGMVRQAAYKGLDLGKDPRAVRREKPAS